ncbi:putative tick transposon [Operophtera brumata]|uniref:Putative tick transposon n=1 Tax=Operophtera brumata TaxID=104452 RepID=A0A0L7LFA5_OPEBR|nr:putative tick transposon [Operophtera brumata]
MLASFGLIQGIDRPTRNDKTCLDHFMVKTRSKVDTAVFERLTDHNPILLYMSHANIPRKELSFSKLTINFAKIGTILSNNDIWKAFYMINDVNEAADFLINMLQKIIRENSTNKKISNKKQPLKPWITVGVVRSIRTKNKLYKKVKISGDEDLKQKYLKYRNTCNKLIKFLKKQYYKNKLTKSLGNSKETWKIIKEVCNNNQSKTTHTELLTLGPSFVESLNHVNNYFTTIGRDLAGQTLSKFCTNELELSRNARELNAPLQSMMLAPNNSVGSDTIPTNLIKMFKKDLALPISYLYPGSCGTDSRSINPSSELEARALETFQAAINY